MKPATQRDGIETITPQGRASAGLFAWPCRLTRTPDWRADRWLILEVENLSDFMVNLRVMFQGDGRTSRILIGLFPQWPVRIPLPLGAAVGLRLFLDRTPGRFKTTVQGALRGFEEVREIILSVPEGLDSRVRLDRVAIEQGPPCEFLLPREPLVDDLHQWRTRQWPGKARSLDEVRAILEKEIAAQPPDWPAGWSRYGGIRARRFSATGFFRTEHDGQRWWLVDPDGCAFWSIGCDCIRPMIDVNVTGIESVFASPLPSPQKAPHLWRITHGQRLFNALAHNLERALGPSWRERWTALTARRLRAYALNTIGNWSDPTLPSACGIPYVFTMEGFPSTDRMLFRDFPDVFAPEYELRSREFARQLEPHRDDPAMIGYFMANEPQWAFVEGFDLGDLLLSTDAPSATRAVLVERLRETYGTVAALNAAWRSRLTSFDDLFRAIPPQQRPGSRPDTQAFTRLAVDRFLRLPAEACRAADPNHLNLGLRWAWIHSEYQLAAADVLDVFSINHYQLRPDATAIDRIAAQTGRPVIIGEFHVGSLDRGLPSGGIRCTRTLAESVQAYRHYLEQAATVPALVGAHYFQWHDQHVLGRFDGENMQIGWHDVTGRAYPEWADALRPAHEALYAIRLGEAKPLTPAPELVQEGTLVG